MRLFNWNGQNGSENTAADSLGPKSARPLKDFESCETVSIAESAQCPLVRCPAQLPSRRKSNEDGFFRLY